jgi:hypothetical protein
LISLNNDVMKNFCISAEHKSTILIKFFKTSSDTFFKEDILKNNQNEYYAQCETL